MKAGELAERVRRRLGLITEDPLAEAGDLLDLVNDALHQLETRHPQAWPWLFAETTFQTSSGDDNYDVPDDWMKVYSLKLTLPGSSAKAEMPRYSIGQLEEMYPYEATQQPQCFAVWGRTLRLRPIPDGTYTITHRYVRTEPDVTDDDDEPIMPSTFHGAIVEQAVELQARRVGAESQANTAQAAVDRWVRQMVGYSREYIGPGRVRDRGW